MELVTDDEGHVAPRLNDVALTPEQAREDYACVIQDVIRMLCVGLVHGDLSEFNVLVDDYGPVIIDLPQAVDAAANNNAQAMLERDVRNMSNYYGQFAPDIHDHNYKAQEIWALFEDGQLTPDTQLNDDYRPDEEEADVDGVMQEIKEALREQEERLERMREEDDA